MAPMAGDLDDVVFLDPAKSLAHGAEVPFGVACVSIHERATLVEGRPDPSYEMGAIVFPQDLQGVTATLVFGDGGQRQKHCPATRATLVALQSQRVLVLGVDVSTLTLSGVRR